MTRLWMAIVVLVVGCTSSSKDQGSDTAEASEPSSSDQVDEDGDGSLADDDCDDSDADVYPGADEICNGQDDDCDSEIDEGLKTTTWYEDADGDGHGDDSSGMDACEQPSGHVSENTDCDDTDPDVHPDADEVCNGESDDCDDEIDEDSIDALTWYEDADDDSYGDSSSTAASCDQPSGYVADDTDCDDDDPDTYPGAPEVCDDGIEQNCNGLIDCEDAECATWATCYESDCENGDDDDHDGLVDCADDECAGLGDCRVVVSRVLDGELTHEHTNGTWNQDGVRYWARWSTQICYSATPSGGTSTFYVSSLETDIDRFDTDWYQMSDALVARDISGTVRIYENSASQQCGWHVDTMQLGRSSTFYGTSPITDLSRIGFTTTGGCGLDSFFLPTNLVPQSGWARISSSSGNPWYAASHSTMGGSLSATHLGSTTNTSTFTTTFGYNTTSGNWYTSSWTNADHTITNQLAGWQIASPQIVAGQPHQVEVPCGDPSVSLSTWYVDSDGDGYGDASLSVIACEAPSTYVDNDDDDDDTDASSH